MPWLTPIVFKQGPEESLTRIPRFDDGPRSIRFRHVVHSYTDRAVADNNLVQNISFDTIQQAIKFAAPEYRVDCVAVTYAEDARLVPTGIIVAPYLDRAITDFAEFRTRRTLPLLFDVLNKGAAAKLDKLHPQSWLQRMRDALIGAKTPTMHDASRDDEYFVMTNSDIHLQPAFYRVLAEFIGRGYDVITTNRRTIDVDPGDRVFSPLFMADRGSDHAGFDCFAFPTSMLAHFASSRGCCGSGHVMRSLIFNLVAHARRFLMLTHAQLTYHLGNDEHWGSPELLDYMVFNIVEARSVISVLSRSPDKAKRLEDFIRAHEGEDYRNMFGRKPDAG